MDNDTRDESLPLILEAIGKTREALDGMFLHDQLAVLAQISGYLLITTEQKYGKVVGEKARTNFATMLRNTCYQLRKENRES